IVIPEKKLKKPVEIKQEVVNPPAKPETKKPEAKKVEVKNIEVKPEGKMSANGVKGGSASGAGQGAADSQASRDKAAQESAAGRVVDEYSGKIKSKIKRNIVMPPGVANDARAEFTVTLLPGGTVLNVHLTRSSGNPTYDSAVERAILKSDPLPLPEDQGMFKRFRELNLSFKPVE
ncbi:MAG: protein TolA, partial [Gallionellales bacterium RIFOXYB12_FULL_54_9]